MAIATMHAPFFPINRQTLLCYSHVYLLPIWSSVAGNSIIGGEGVMYLASLSMESFHTQLASNMNIVAVVAPVEVMHMACARAWDYGQRPTTSGQQVKH